MMLKIVLILESSILMSCSQIIQTLDLLSLELICAKPLKVTQKRLNFVQYLKFNFYKVLS